MKNSKMINGFSKFSREQKLKWLEENYEIATLADTALSYLHPNSDVQKLHDGFSENTITNYFLPYGIAPNFLIDGKVYAVPMVIEESSVVAAASSAAKFWSERGGFKTTVIDTLKVGHISFSFNGSLDDLQKYSDELFKEMIEQARDITSNMEKRGGGIKKMEFIKVQDLHNIFQLLIHFETCESMGANFINSVLESFASYLEIFFEREDIISKHGESLIIMSILSNYTPQCLVRAKVECEVDKLNISSSPADNILALANKFKTAVDIASVDVYRATTHNKGIYNGIDAVVIATGNDFRAIEAAGHAYAARDGRYRSLSRCTIENGIFTFELEVPMAVGTVGGLTSLHPMAKRSLEIMGNPSAKELMSIIASVGLAQNFAAIRSLVTTGIQKGHMKMHLQNILSNLKASDEERDKAVLYFEDKTISFSDVRTFIENIRNA